MMVMTGYDFSKDSAFTKEQVIIFLLLKIHNFLISICLPLLKIFFGNVADIPGKKISETFFTQIDVYRNFLKIYWLVK